MPKFRPALERFFDLVEITPEGCWLWLGTKLKRGYGLFYPYHGKGILAHRYAYINFVGEIPEGKELDHIVCDNPSCASPWHTKPVTHGENVLRDPASPSTINKAKTHCCRGHSLIGDNLAFGRRGDGRITRVCKTCRRARDKQYAHKLRNT